LGQVMVPFDFDLLRVSWEWSPTKL
jgi:hypothetical protein